MTAIFDNISISNKQKREMTRETKKLTVIDFFCGAGGFSEGFRQQGYEIVMGIDNWIPALETHNLNHGLCDSAIDVLTFTGSDSSDTEKIDTLQNTDIIIGSPPCVLFSMANKAGKADKTLGISLILAYFRVVAVKKHQENSTLKAWLMENVPNSGNFVRDTYTFKDLNLSEWAAKNSLSPEAVAIVTNGRTLNASSYGAPQNRNRFVCGEVTSDGSFPEPSQTHEKPMTLKDIRSKMPKPNQKKSNREWMDPNFSNLKVRASELTDHFYDTGIYITEWEQAKYLKTMHPFMGRMSFPENEDRPSRTITATRSVSTREALIYKSEYKRTGNGEYRLPTIREAATLMGYPYVYQFAGSEGTKWKLIGNSVSPQLSSALAKAILNKEGLKPVSMNDIDFKGKNDLYLSVDNLNTFSSKEFAHRIPRKRGARFRRSVYKGQNTTVDLLNYNPGQDILSTGEWHVGVFYGTGSNHGISLLNQKIHSHLKELLQSNFNGFNDYYVELKKIANNQLSPRRIQTAFEEDASLMNSHNPLVIIQKIQELCRKIDEDESRRLLPLEGLGRKDFPLAQLLLMFSLSFIIYDCLYSNTGHAEEIGLPLKTAPAFFPSKG